MTSWIQFIAIALLCLLGLLLGWLTARGYGVARMEWFNLSRLRQLRERWESAGDSPEKIARGKVLERCETIRARWILPESELHVMDHTYDLVESIARAYRPRSERPLQEARVRKLLKGFLDLKQQVEQWTRLRGVHALTRFRLRHLHLLAEAWKRKQQWDQSRPGRAAARFKVYFWAKWVYALARCLDLTFWFFKMMFYFVHDIVFKVFLLRWYLVVGELAIQVYSEDGAEYHAPDEDVLEEMDKLPDPEEMDAAHWPEEVQSQVRDSRKTLWLHNRPIQWSEARAVYGRLVEDIARCYHPRSPRPLHEARVYDLMVSLARFAEQIVKLEQQPVISKILDLRVSHLMRVKDTTDWVVDNPLFDFIKKYRVGPAVKYSTLIYKAFKKSQPGILFKDFAFTLAREGVKRWLYVYLHDKIAAEACFVYRGKEDEGTARR